MKVIYTVEFHLSGLIGTASHSVMQKIRIIEFFFENSSLWQFELGRKILQTAVYLGKNKILVHNSLYVFENWEEKFKPYEDVVKLQ
jgi:hypothetical protein